MAEDLKFKIKDIVRISDPRVYSFGSRGIIKGISIQSKSYYVAFERESVWFDEEALTFLGNLPREISPLIVWLRN